MPDLSRPNILFIVFDSLSAIDDSLTRSSIATPTLDRLFNGSAQFAQTYAPCPESSPARASLFAGLDPCVHGLWTNGVKLTAGVKTSPEIIRQVGYANWLVG